MRQLPFLRSINTNHLRIFAGAVTFAFVIWMSVDAFSKFSFDTVALGPLLISCLLYGAVVASLPLFWVMLLKAYGSKWSARNHGDMVDLFLVYFRSWIARYLPGRIWMFGGRVLYGSAIGIPKWTVIKTTLVEGLGLQLLLAWLSGVVFLAFYGQWAAAVGIAVLFILALAAYVKYQQHVIALIPIARLREVLAPVDWREATGILLLGTVITVLQLAAVALLANAMFDAGSATAWQISGLWGLSVVAGYLTMVTPAGFGVREAVGVLLLSTVIDRTDAVVFMGVVRAVTLIVDVTLAVVVESYAHGTKAMALQHRA